METYFCVCCGDTTEEQFLDDITELEDVEKRDKPDLFNCEQESTDPHINHPEIICSECTYNYYHAPYCSLCGSPGDYCQGHSADEEMAVNDGICPICDEYIGPHADAVINAREGEEPSGTWCHWHGLLEWREYHEKKCKNPRVQTQTH